MKTKIQVFMVDDNKDVVTEVKKYFSSKNVGVEIECEGVKWEKIMRNHWRVRFFLVSR